MTIDVMVTSCARPDVLDVSFHSFRERLKTSHDIRWVLVEDYMEDPKRRALGMDWMNTNLHYFDEVILLTKNAGKGWWWYEMLKRTQSQLHFHLEDDNDFLMDIELDPMVETMLAFGLSSILLAREGGIDKRVKPKPAHDQYGITLTPIELFSISTGLFDTNKCRQMIDVHGWDKQPHEAGTLMPLSEKLGMRKFYLGSGEAHYDHVGERKGYIKGSWRPL